MLNRKFWTTLCALTLVVALVLPVASVMAQDGPEEIELEEVDPLAVSGDIAIAGSSTVEPVTVEMARRFNEDGFEGSIAIAETGSSAGFERFCSEGSTDISNASRAIKSSEVENCQAIGREPLGFQIGVDAIAITVNQDSPVDQLKRSELIAIFTGEVTTWAEVNPEWPDEEIQLYIPGTDSGTFDYFGEAVLGSKGMWGEREDRFAALLEPDPTTSENDYTLVEGIMGSSTAIGYFGFAYYVENEDTLKAIAVADDVVYDSETEEYSVVPEEEWEAEGISYVEPNAESAETGDYMLARPLFIYSAASIMQEKPQVAAFISYYLTNATEVVVEVGYFPASVELLNASKQMYLDAMGM